MFMRGAHTTPHTPPVSQFWHANSYRTGLKRVGMHARAHHHRLLLPSPRCQLGALYDCVDIFRSKEEEKKKRIRLSRLPRNKGPGSKIIHHHHHHHLFFGL